MKISMNIGVSIAMLMSKSLQNIVAGVSDAQLILITTALGWVTVWVLATTAILPHLYSILPSLQDSFV